MTIDRATAVAYWTAVGIFLTGVAIVVVAAAAGIHDLERPGEIVIVTAWVVGAAGAAVDMIRHRGARQLE